MQRDLLYQSIMPTRVFEVYHVLKIPKSTDLLFEIFKKKYFKTGIVIGMIHCGETWQLRPATASDCNVALSQQNPGS